MIFIVCILLVLIEIPQNLRKRHVYTCVTSPSNPDVRERHGTDET